MQTAGRARREAHTKHAHTRKRTPEKFSGLCTGWDRLARRRRISFCSNDRGNGIPRSRFSAPVEMSKNGSICVQRGTGMGQELLHARDGNGSNRVLFGT